MPTTNEAAGRLNLKPKTVTRYIIRGLIKAEKRGRDYWIEEDEIERYARTRREPGRPRKEG